MTVATGSNLMYEASRDMETEPNFELTKSAMAPNLKLLEGLLSQAPKNRELLLTLNKGYTALAFVVNETDMLEEEWSGKTTEDNKKQALKNYTKAMNFGMRYLETKSIKGSFSEWRNEGLKLAKGKWILYIDTDEEVTKDLKEEIIKIVSDSKIKCSGYGIPRKNIIFGKEFKHSGLYPDYQKRLFWKKDFDKWSGDLHEEPKFSGNLCLLKNPIIHHKNMTIGEMLEKTNKWSEIEGQLMFDAKHPKMNIFRFFSAGLREFYLRMIKQSAFLDGTKGVIYAFYQVYSKLISYTKLWEKQQSTIRT